MTPGCSADAHAEAPTEKSSVTKIRTLDVLRFKLTKTRRGSAGPEEMEVGIERTLSRGDVETVGVLSSASETIRCTWGAWEFTLRRDPDAWGVEVKYEGRHPYFVAW